MCPFFFYDVTNINFIHNKVEIKARIAISMCIAKHIIDLDTS
jgi:hypothetical protein